MTNIPVALSSTVLRTKCSYIFTVFIQVFWEAGHGAKLTPASQTALIHCSLPTIPTGPQQTPSSWSKTHLRSTQKQQGHLRQTPSYWLLLHNFLTHRPQSVRSCNKTFSLIILSTGLHKDKFSTPYYISYTITAKYLSIVNSHLQVWHHCCEMDLEKW